MEISITQELEIGKSYQFDVDTKNSHIIVNGALINQAVIEKLNFIQLEKSGCYNDIFCYVNDGYKDIAADFAEVFSYLVYSIEYTGEKDKVMELLKSLHFQLQRIKELTCPDKLKKEFRHYQE